MRYLQPFGLRDNPFWPRRIDGVSRNLTDTLVSRPLRVDKSPQLEALYVAQAGQFDQYQNDFESRIDDAGFTAENDFVGSQSQAVLVVGPEGTGKSTFINVLIRALTNGTGVSAEQPLRVSMSPDVSEQVKSIRDKAEQSGEPDSLCIAVIDRVQADALEQLFDLYEELIETRLVVFLMESDDLRLIAPSARDSERIPLTTYRTNWLTAGHAQAFVQSRLAFFRDPDYAEHLAGAQSFPFRLEEIDGVGSPIQAGVNGEGTGRMSFRNLSKLLAEALRVTAKQLPEDHDIRNIRHEELERYTIDLPALYAKLLPQ